MKSVDDLPYAFVGAIFGGVCFFLGNLLFNHSAWQLIMALVVGAILGCLAGVMALRSKRLSCSATMREMKLAMERESRER
ncbi:hypothetical protein [Bradyrhizobium sp. STM 3557]|uniref:hypothetical protein n=1 Tax=Bradyrhizobium sp. STM 3557 TaxID=578920 RepID=UPI00388ED87C